MVGMIEGALVGPFVTVWEATGEDVGLVVGPLEGITEGFHAGE